MNAILAESILLPGMRLSQPEFHARYSRLNGDTKFELVGGIVYMASPLGRGHGSHHIAATHVLTLFLEATPGVEAFNDASTILGDADEVRPDLSLRIRPELGGASRNTGEYIGGTPELIIEVADSNEDVALGAKLAAYRDAGGREYLVVCLASDEVCWFDLRRNSRLRPDANGVFKSRVFPGLWMNGPALLAGDVRALGVTARLGLATPEHARFVERLERRRQAHERRNRPSE